MEPWKLAFNVQQRGQVSLDMIQDRMFLERNERHDFLLSRGVWLEDRWGLAGGIGTL